MGDDDSPESHFEDTFAAGHRAARPELVRALAEGGPDAIAWLSELGVPFTRLGMHPGMAATYLLPEVAGLAVARELLLTGRIVTGAEAAALGVVNRAVPRTAVLDEALQGIAEPRVYLKLDTQGYDLLAFRGAGRRVDDLLAMQSEVSCLPIYEGMPQLEEQLGEYRSAGFDIAGLFPVSMHRPTLRVLEFDAVMVRKEAFSASRA